MEKYLIHFNKNHSSKNGQFTFGDGDGDGVIDDHHHYSRNRVKSVISNVRSKTRNNRVEYEPEPRKEVNPVTLKMVGTAAKWAAGKAFAATKLGSTYNSIIRTIRESSYIDEALADTNIKNWKTRKENEFYIRAADFLNKHGKEYLA